jgi:hypothetical protein
MPLPRAVVMTAAVGEGSRRPGKYGDENHRRPLEAFVDFSDLRNGNHGAGTPGTSKPFKPLIRRRHP